MSTKIVVIIMFTFLSKLIGKTPAGLLESHLEKIEFQHTPPKVLLEFRKKI